MVITRDSLGHLEVPEVILCKASEERIGALQCTHKTWTHKYNDLDTLSLEIPYLTDGKETPFYDEIDIMKYIEVPAIGRFCIKDIDIVSEGQRTEYKKIECVDYSSLLGQQYLEEFYILGLPEEAYIDDVDFYNPGLQTKSLLHLILEKFPEWSYDYVAPSLWTMQRHFEVSRQDVYSFMTQDISEAFECVFVFNSLAKSINVYLADQYGIDTNIHVSYNALLENTELSYSIDDIKTALTLSGNSDEVNVRELNLGYDRIYNFEYFASEEYMSASLLAAYTAWKNLVNSPVDTSLFEYKAGVITKAELQGKTYEQAFEYLGTKYQDLYTKISQWTSTKLPEGINTRASRPGYGTIEFYTSSGTPYTVTFEKPDTTTLVTSIPSSGNETTLYLVKNTNNMYRFKGGTRYNVNEWKECCLNELKTIQASAERMRATSMKAKHGEESSTFYVPEYLPRLYMYNAVTAQIGTVQTLVNTLTKDLTDYIEYDKSAIVNRLDIKNSLNFNTQQRKELSTFLREDTLSSSSFTIEDNMTEAERFEMLRSLLDYGEKELVRVSTPQLQFSAGLNNLFAIPEFDQYSGDFDIGNYVWVTLRDDYSVKAKILEVELDFLDQSSFRVTFGNVVRKAKNIFTDVTDAINAATSAATSVSFNSSYWSASAKETDSIGQALADGLLAQSYYLSNDPANNETLINDAGLWITTTDDREHGRIYTQNYDAIYLGGGRILFTSDGWRSVRMSVGRSVVNMPTIENGHAKLDGNGKLITTDQDLFGTFADFVMAGYLGGSIIVGGEIYSENYQTNSSNKNSGNYGTYINLTDGTFEFNSKTSPGKKRLTLNSSGELEVNGTIHAKAGNIGSDDNGSGGFIIQNLKMYSNKTSFNDPDHNGIYFGSDSRDAEYKTNGISLGKYGAYKTGKNPFSVDMNGNLVANHGEIANFTLTGSSLYSDAKKSLIENVNGVYIGSDGIGLGMQTTYTTTSGTDVKASYFQVDNKGNLYAGSVNVKGRITATSGYIGNGTSGFTITSTSIYNGKPSLTNRDNDNGVYIGTNGISLGRIDENTDAFRVTSKGVLTSKSGTIGGWSIGTDTISHKSGSNTITLSAKDNNLSFNNKITLNGNGSLSVASGLFSIDTSGKIHSTGGDIGGFTISGTALYTNGKSDMTKAVAGVLLSSSGIALGYDKTKKTSPFSVDSNGSLYSTSGTIGGWTINATNLEGTASSDGDKIVINSSGNLYHTNTKTGESNWSINRSGRATFTDVYITGVRSGSEFGKMGYNGGDYNWGTFGGTSYFGCSDNIEPFSGGAVKHIENLAVKKLTADWIDGKYIKADLLTASNITTGTLDAEKVKVTNIDASNITTGTLSAARIDADHLSVKAANISGTLSASKIRLNGNEVTNASGYVFTDKPSGTVVVDNIAYTVNMHNYRKMYIMGYYGSE